jgi:hypothetical protein
MVKVQYIVDPPMNGLTGGVGNSIMPIVHYIQIMYIYSLKSPKQYCIDNTNAYMQYTDIIYYHFAWNPSLIGI